MEPQASSGSFGSVLGGGSALSRALASRQGGGQGVAPLSQVSPSVSTGEGMPPAPPTGSGMPQGMPQSSGAPQTPGMPVGSSESELIIKALSNRLSSLSKIEQGPQV